MDFIGLGFIWLRISSIAAEVAINIKDLIGCALIIDVKIDIIIGFSIKLMGNNNDANDIDVSN